MNDRFPLTIELSFDVSYWQNKSGMTNQEIADYVVAQVETERNELVVEAKVVLLRVLDGDIPADLPGLALEPGVTDLALGLGTGQKEDKAQPVGWFARLGGFISRKREET